MAMNKPFIIVGVLLLVLTGTVKAENFSAQVVDKKSKESLPMTLVKVIINNDGIISTPPTKIERYTDNSGKLEFEVELNKQASPETLEYDLQVKRTGYSPFNDHGYMLKFPELIELFSLSGQKQQTRPKKLIKIEYLH